MKRSAVVLTAMMVAMFVVALASPPPAHAVQTLFYDSFTSTYLTPSWSGVQNDPVLGILQSFTSVFTNGGGSMTLQSLRQGVGGDNGGVIANSTSPLFSGSTADGQLVDLIYSVKPFNLTLSGVSSFLSASLMFGMADRITPYCCASSVNTFGANNGIWWQLSYGTGASGVQAGVSVVIQRPGVSDTICFGNSVGGGCATENGPIIYNPSVSPLSFSTVLDLTQPHIFQMIVHRLASASRTWAAFSVDSGVVMNITQGACSCLGGSGAMRPLFPFVYQSYAWNTIPPSSQGATIAYILAVDYIPPNPTLGFYPSPNPCTGAGGAIPTPINPNGCRGQPNASTDLGTAFQQFAVIAGGGNVYFGGAFITLIVLAMFTVPIAMFMTRNVFIHSFITIFVVSFMTFVSILPIYVIVVDIVLGAGIIFRIISGRTGGGSMVATSQQ